MDKKKLSLRQWLILLSLAIILPLSTLMVSLLRTEYGVKTSIPPIAIQQNYWREIKGDTSFSYDDLRDIVSQVNSARLTQHEQDSMLLSMLVDKASKIDQEMLRYVVKSTVGDFINYQAEIFEDVDSQVKQDIRDGLLDKKETESLYFYDNMIIGDAESFISNQSGVDNYSLGAKDNTAALYAALVAAGMAGWAASTVTGAMSTIGWTASQGWWIPSFVKAAAIGVALLVIVGVIVMYWNQIASIFQAIINYFVEVARDFAGQIIDFFNNLRGQAQEANKTINDVIRTEEEFKKLDIKALTTDSANSTEKGKFYASGIIAGTLKFLPIPFRDRGLATQTFIALGASIRYNGSSGGGVYTFLGNDASIVAQQAGGGLDPILASSDNENLSGKFNHWHAYGRSPEGHAWFGVKL
ncbi:MAG: hypothetical protein FWF56_00065 [Firmicutes bacterium]|nr:hypothetical protein [Bacillota bacterium]MCL1953762.1 hypothetical protein [Bacillota bacterium]